MQRGMVVEGDGNELLTDYVSRRGETMGMDMRRKLEAYGISRVADLVRYGDESRGGTKRTSEPRVGREEWGELCGRQVQVWERNRERAGTITGYENSIFEIRYADGQSGELSARDCLHALVPDKERLEWKWIRLPVELEELGASLGPPPQITKVTIARDQCWETENIWYPRSEGWVWEVLGTRGQEVCVRTWVRKKVTTRGVVVVGDEVKLESRSHGAATDVWLPVHDMFYDTNGQRLPCQRVLLGPDVNQKGITRVVIHKFQQGVVGPYESVLEIELLSQMQGYASATEGSNFTTDGSLRYETNPIFNAFVPEPYTIGRQIGMAPEATGALIARKDSSYASQGSEAAIRVIDGADVRCRNSYDIEILLLTMGCMIRREYELGSYHREQAYIRSDSMAAVNKGIGMDLAGVRREGYKRHGLLLRRIFHSRYGMDQMIEHVHGHPERRFRKGDRWQTLVGKEAGIYLADRAANTRLSQKDMETIAAETKEKVLTVTAKEVLIAISAIDLWCVVDKEGTPILECPSELVQRVRFRQYLQQRQEQGGHDYWTDYVESAPEVVFPIQHSTWKQAKDTKIVFNWYMRAEHKNRREDAVVCPWCGGDMQGDTERHVYTQCTHVIADNCRREMEQDLVDIVAAIPAENIRQRGIGEQLCQMLTAGEERHLLWKGIVRPRQVQDLNQTLQHFKEKGEEESSQETKGITKMIKEMLRRTGRLLQEIRGHTAHTGYLMPNPIKRRAALTSAQQIIRQIQKYPKIDRTKGWTLWRRQRESDAEGSQEQNQ